MKNITFIIALILTGAVVTPTIVMGDVKKGHRLYKKKLQKKCNFPGSIFARKHTQDTWEVFKEKGTFKMEVNKICPKVNLAKFTDAQLTDLYDFSYEIWYRCQIPNGCDPK